MAHYFYILNGVQNGPILQEQLISAGVTASTLVWKEGMTDWMAAGQVSELAPLFYQATPPPYQGANIGTPPVRVKPDNYLVWAILSTIFCCMPAGIASIIYAASVESKYNNGDYAGAEKASKNAKTWAIVSAVLGLAVCAFAFFAALLGEL